MNILIHWALATVTLSVLLSLWGLGVLYLLSVSLEVLR